MAKVQAQNNRRRVFRKRPARRENERQEAMPHPAAAIQRARQNPQALAASDVLQLQRTLGNRATARLLAQRQPAAISRSDASAIQRQILWLDGPRDKNVDLVNTATQGLDYGITPLQVNGHEFPGTGDPLTAISPPQLHFEPAGGTKVRLSVMGEPANIVGYRMELPAPAPWQRHVSMEMAASAISIQSEGGKFDKKLRPYSQGSGNTLLKVKGLPNDTGFADLVETHEDHHVEEVREGIKETLKPWDDKIKEFKDGGHSFEAESQAKAKEAFYSLMGGTPAEIGKAFVDNQKTKGTAYHKTKEGSSPTVADVKTTGNLSELAAYFKHPLG